MTATGQNFEVFQGDRKQLEVPVYDENNELIDLNPFTEITWVAYHPTTKSIVLTKTLGSGVSLGSFGILLVDLLPADTVNITPNTYNHECEISDGANEVATVFTGNIKIIYSRA